MMTWHSEEKAIWKHGEEKESAGYHHFSFSYDVFDYMNPLPHNHI